MRIETIKLPASGYGTHVPALTAYIQDNVEAQREKRRPAMIICPGGGYEFCSDREAEPMALAFVARGYQAFVLDYDVLAPELAAKGACLLPAPQQNLAHAVALVRARAADWMVDEERICILGCSAGGHLCAAYSGLAQRAEFAANMGYTCDDIAVYAQVLCYPVIDLTAGWPYPAEERIPALCDRAGDLVATQDLVGAATPRTFIWHTASDQGVPVKNTYLYAAALARAGVDHDCHVFHAGRHGLSLATPQTSKRAEHEVPHAAHWLDLAVEWLDEDPVASLEAVGEGVSGWRGDAS